MWEYSPSTNVDTYFIKYGTNSGVYFYSLNAGKTNLVTILGLSDTTWYFVATAKDTNNNIESGPSNEVWKYLGTNGIAPITTKGFSANMETSHDINGPWRLVATFVTNIAMDADEQWYRSVVKVNK